MSHQRFPSMDPTKEPHSVSLKVLRLSRPSLVTQHTLRFPDPSANGPTKPIPASYAYRSNSGTNPDPFLLTPILNLPPSFGSAYVGETFSCTLCTNCEVPSEPSIAITPPTPVASTFGGATLAPQQQDGQQSPIPKRKSTRDVKIEAEMKTPGSGTPQKLELSPVYATDENGKSVGVDLDPGHTLQKIVNFDLKEEGNHVLAVTVSYYEASETSGRTRTFRKLYQFICKGSLIVRTKVSSFSPSSSDEDENAPERSRRWVLEAQLENCSEDVMQLERVGLELDKGLRYRDVNWMASASPKPVLHPGEVEQVCFVVEEDGSEELVEQADGRIMFGTLGIGWRSEMGNRGYLSTGKLGMRANR